MALAPPKTGCNATKKPSGVNRSVLYILIGSVVLLSAILFFIATKREEQPSVVPAKNKPATIKKMPCSRPETNTQPEEVVHEKPLLTYRDEKGVLRYKNGGARAFDPDANTKKINYGVDAEGNPIFKRSIFKNVAENEIARLITLRPGDSMIGTRRYDERFENEFKKSLETPIVVSKDDSPEDAELKKAMIAVKIEICDRLAEGEKLRDILNETKNELQRLARIKRNIRQEVLKQTTGDMNEADVQTYIDAANILLEKEGIAPIKGDPILRRNLILQSKGK